MKSIFRQIREYHKQLGQIQFSSYNIQDARNHVLALHAEVSELLDSFPWKPWRPKDYKGIDRHNIKEEIIDCIFFLGAIAEIFGIDERELDEHFWKKLEENYDRIKRGYNVTPSNTLTDEKE